MPCSICPLNCSDIGICGVYDPQSGGRVQNSVGLSFGTVEKFGFYHYMPGSPATLVVPRGCNLFCVFCPNHEYVYGNKARITIDSAVNDIISQGSKVVVFSCNSGLHINLIRKVKEGAQLPVLAFSHGYFSRSLWSKFLSVINGVNVWLLGVRDSTYLKLSLAPEAAKYAIEFLKYVVKSDLHVEVTLTLTPGILSEAEFVELLDIIAKMDPEVPLHLVRFRPNFVELSRRPTRTRDLSIFYKIAKERLEYVYAEIWGTRANDTYCPNGHLVIKRFGWKIIDIKLKDNTCPICGKKIRIVHY